MRASGRQIDNPEKSPPKKEPAMVVSCIAIAFVLLVASPALAAFLPLRGMEDEARPSGRLSKVFAPSALHRG
jgi:hypothetical protein